MRGVIFLLSLFFTAYFGTLYLLTPALFLYPLNKSLYRKWCDRVGVLWFSLPNWFFEYFEMKFIFTGDWDNLKNDSCLIIMNHRTRLDWLFFFNVIGMKGRLHNFKIVLKDILGKAPGFGWAMQKFCFLFLRRKWEEDQITIQNSLQYFSRSKYPLQFLLFPEGTDLSRSNQSKDADYSRRYNKEIFNYVLHPRTTGFTFINELLRDTIECIYDVDIAFPDFVPQNEDSLAKGKFPKEVHFHAQRYPISQIPQDKDQAAEWINNRWKEKEERLKDYYENKKRIPPQNSPEKGYFIGTPIFWIVSVLGIVYLSFFTTYGWYWFLFANILEITITLLGGIQKFEVTPVDQSSKKTD